ncbi:MAG: type II toxin-antitoxin system HigB family toxin [Fimbriimonas sp.]
MRTVAWAMLREFGESRPDAMQPLQRWFKTTEKADWNSLHDVKLDFPKTDQVGERLIFNIGGNKYRLICTVHYGKRIVLVKWIGTHAEYDRIKNVEEL